MAIAAPVFVLGHEVVDQLVVGLSHGCLIPLHGGDCVGQHLRAREELCQAFLHRCHLHIGGGHGLAQDLNLLDRMGCVVVLRRLLGCGCFATDVVQEVLAALGEELVLELPGVIAMVGRRRIVAVPNLMEVVLVQLSHERGKVAMLEVLGQDLVGKLM